MIKRNAMAIAQFLEQHEAVKRVLYPGLPSHPQYEIIKQQQHGFGSIITFNCIGNRTQSNLILQNVRVYLYINIFSVVISKCKNHSPLLFYNYSEHKVESIYIG